MPSSGMLRHMSLLRTDVSEELSASIFRVIRIGVLGTLVVTGNRRTLCICISSQRVYVTGRKAREKEITRKTET
jgi:hypothetical protein